jgi:nucleotide-binding universal stress UspA family protein
MGSVAEGVLRTSVRPVMTVHADSPGRTTARSAIKHILVPTDLSEPSERALDVAIDLARAFDARITLLHVWSVPSYGYVDEVTWPRAPLMRAAEAALEAARTRATRTYAKTEAVLREGSAWERIIEIASERACDLVVMGACGRSGAPRAILGGTAAMVVRLCALPVVTVGADGGHMSCVDVSPMTTRKERKPKPAHDASAQTHHLHEAGGAAGGAIAGAALGSIAGPLGAATGAVLGGVLGAVVAKVGDEESERTSAHDSQLDAIIGVSGGDLGAPNLKHPPALRGTYSAASSGAGAGAGSGKPDASGPMSAPDE